MEIRNFKAGSYRQQYEYKSFSPNLVNIDWELSDQFMINLLSSTDVRLGELNAFSQLIPNIDFFIKMHISKEANLSSKIEGTQTNLEEVLQKEDKIDPEKRDDWKEVHNYIEAMNFAIDKLSELPISSRLIRETHKVLLSGVRGKHKQPGEFRRSQNWLGGASLKDAVFIPPDHAEVPDLMGDLEKFLNREDNIPMLIKAGIAHYQFETIHPFLDGNGRVGRLMITLFLMSTGLLARPCLYLSDYLERNRNLYYENLTRVRVNNDMRQWLMFFLNGVRETAQSSIDTFRKIIAMKHVIETQKLVRFGRRIGTAQILLNYLFTQPIVEASDVAEVLDVNISTANRLIESMIEYGILREMTGYKRNRIFIFKEYFDLFDN